MIKFTHITVKYFNGYHIAMILLPLIMLFLMYLSLNDKEEKVQDRCLLLLSSLAIVLFLSYKIYMSRHYDDFKWIDNLPLQLCNINLIVLPVALLKKNKTMFAFLYFVGIIGGLIGVVMFDTYFLGRSAFSFPVLVYFVYHSMLVMFPILLVLLGKYTPCYKDVLKAEKMLFVLALIMFVFNKILRIVFFVFSTNYFYTMGLEGNPFVDLLWRIIPVPFLFFLPVAPVLYGVNMLMAMPFEIKKAKEIEC